MTFNVVFGIVIVFPSDIDIYLFDKSVIAEDQLMTKNDFGILYSDNKSTHLTKCRDKLITSFNTTYDINGTGTINGYIQSGIQIFKGK